MSEIGAVVCLGAQDDHLHVRTGALREKQLNSVRLFAVQVSVGCALARAKLQNSPLRSYHARGVGFEKQMAEQNTIKVYMEPHGIYIYICTYIYVYIYI